MGSGVRAAVAVLLVVAAPWAGDPGQAVPWSRPVAGTALAFSPTASSPALDRPTHHDSMLVFAAHPDDETLGAGGLIHAAVAAGSQVHVVIFTNGDGYLEGVDVGFHTLFSTPDLFIQYGRSRQQEALAAAARVGLAAGQVTFLGYPDRGLAVLWGSAWDCRRPYTSPYTRRSRSPYLLTYRPGAAYCGQNVLQDVEGILRRARPTAIVVHHPQDTHRDHWAAGAFVTLAAERLTLEDLPWASTVRVLQYLVHGGTWPRPQAYAPDLVLDPPEELRTAGTGWAQFPLDPADEDAKRQAILEYRSQTQLLRMFMLSFVRRNELFDLPSPVWPTRVDGGLSLAAPERWDGLAPMIWVPGSGSLIHAAGGSAELESIALARDAGHLYIAVRLRKPAIREARYRVELRLVYRDGRLARLPLVFRVPQSLTAPHGRPEDVPLPPGAAARSFGPRIDIVLPLGPLGDPASLLMQVLGVGPFNTLVNRSPWTLVHLETGRPQGAPGDPASIHGRP